MNLPTELAELLEAVCMGELTDAQRLRLEELVISHVDARRHYVRYLAMHALAERLEGADAPSEGEQLVRHLAPTEATAPPADTNLPQITPAPLRVGSDGRQYWRRHPIYFWTFVSALTLLLAVSFLFAWQGPFDASGPLVDLTHPHEPTLNDVVASTISLTDPQWGKGSNIQGDLGLLRAGEKVVLESGLVQIKFGGGAEVLLAGPCELVIDSKDAAALLLGKLTASVPPAAAGFAVAAAGRDFVDLGTEFTLEVNGQDEAALGVHSGKVEVWRAGNRELVVSAGQAWRLPARSARQSLALIDIAPLQVPEPEAVRWPLVSGHLHWLDEMPLDPETGLLAFADEPMIFPEARGITLPEALQVDVRRPGTYNADQVSPETLPAGTKVDLYLVHLHRAEPLRGGGQRSAPIFTSVVKFNRPILGVVMQGELLFASEESLRIAVPRANERAKATGWGLDGTTNPNAKTTTKIYDYVQLSEDLRRLRIQLRAPIAADQLRIIVEAAEESAADRETETSRNGEAELETEFDPEETPRSEQEVPM